MKIDPKNLIASLDPRAVSTEKPEARPEKLEKRETPQGDRVDLTINRKLININELSADEAQATVAQLDSDRLAAIQQKIRSGYYGSDAALKGTADGILELFSA